MTPRHAGRRRQATPATGPRPAATLCGTWRLRLLVVNDSATNRLVPGSPGAQVLEETLGAEARWTGLADPVFWVCSPWPAA